MLLVGRPEGHLACKKIWGGWWRWALVSPDGVAPSRMVSVSASVNLPLHHKVQKFSSGTISPGWSRKKGRKTVVVVCGGSQIKNFVTKGTLHSSLVQPTVCSFAPNTGDPVGHEDIRQGLKGVITETVLQKYTVCWIAE